MLEKTNASGLKQVMERASALELDSFDCTGPVSFETYGVRRFEPSGDFSTKAAALTAGVKHGIFTLGWDIDEIHKTPVAITEVQYWQVFHEKHSVSSPGMRDWSLPFAQAQGQLERPFDVELIGRGAYPRIHSDNRREGGLEVVLKPSSMCWGGDSRIDRGNELEQRGTNRVAFAQGDIPADLAEIFGLSDASKIFLSSFSVRGMGGEELAATVNRYDARLSVRLAFEHDLCSGLSFSSKVTLHGHQFYPSDPDYH